MQFVVYILYSDQFDKFYVGQTDDVGARLKRHNAGYEKSTSPYRPWRLVLSVPKESRVEAMILERKLKNLSKQRIVRFIEKYS
jgi:putative endonuclease